MKLAVLSDIHANLEALQAVLDHLQAEGAERVVVTGDLVGYGAEPEACLHLLREAGAVVLAGNHDQAVATGEGLKHMNGEAAAAAPVDPRASPGR